MRKINYYNIIYYVDQRLRFSKTKVLSYNRIFKLRYSSFHGFTVMLLNSFGSILSLCFSAHSTDRLTKSHKIDNYDFMLYREIHQV